jgi:hypothetical protein
MYLFPLTFVYYHEYYKKIKTDNALLHYPPSCNYALYPQSVHSQAAEPILPGYSKDVGRKESVTAKWTIYVNYLDPPSPKDPKLEGPTLCWNSG